MQVVIKTSAIKQLMMAVCNKHGLSDVEGQSVVNNYFEAELLGKRTHGISKFCFESQYFSERKGQPFIMVDTGSLVKIDGNKEVGPIAAEYCAKIAAQRAKQHGICLVGITNMQRYGILRTWVKMFTTQGLFSVILNTCEPAMVGYQGKKKVLGTNPIAFPIQTQNKDYIIDMATSKVAMSLIWQAQREKTALPDDTFYDSEGELTTDPKQAKAVKHFGGIKGFSVSLLLQLLSGSIFGFKMASQIKNMYEIGYVFLVIDPSKTTNIHLMLKKNQELIDELIASGSIVPGSRSTNYIKQDKITLNEDVLAELQRLGEL